MKMLGLALLLLGQNFLLTGLRAAAVTGQVVDLAGAPVENIRVLAFEGLDPDDGPDLVASIARTDHEGRYVLDGIPPGRYLFAAGSLANPIFFPGVPSSDQATALHLKAGVAVPGIDFRVPYGSVSGRVLYQDDSPLSYVRIALTPKPFAVNEDSSKRAGAVLSGQTDKDGRFSIRNVPVGAYDLVAGPENRPALLPFNAEAWTVVIDPRALPPPMELRVAGNHPAITPPQPSNQTDDVEIMLRQLLEERRRRN